MSTRRRTIKKFWNRVFRLTLIYLIIVPIVFYFLDKSSVSAELKTAPVELVLKMAGIAFGISLIISFWGHRDPELRKY
jgi:hypothetical protein